MLALTKKTGYGLIAMGRLATLGDGEVASASAIARQFGVPQALLMNVLKELASAGFIQSVRGAGGGYRLARRPRDIRLSELTGAVERPVRLAECLTKAAGDKRCTREMMARCPLADPVHRFHRKLNDFLQNVTLEEILGGAGLRGEGVLPLRGEGSLPVRVSPLRPAGILPATASSSSSSSVASSVVSSSSSSSSRSSAASPPGPADEREIHKRQGHNLPRWTKGGASYAVTFRLADSLPPHILQGWMRERDAVVQRAKKQGRPLRRREQRELDRLYSTRVEAFLDSGQGACHLAKAQMASLVLDALRRFDGERYDLIAWCIMPNHVHVVARPLGGNDLAAIVHSWKSFTAKQGNRKLGRTGAFWQEEYYDHLIRDEADFHHHLSYVLQNPQKAGLGAWKWVGVQKKKQQEEAEEARGQDALGTQGRDALATRSRP